jgi:hypothetical protein
MDSSTGPFSGLGLGPTPTDFFKRPQVIIKVICILFAIIVFSCIIHGGSEYEFCLYGNDSNACGYGIWIGIIAFIAALLGLVIEAFSDRITNVRERRIVIICELGFSALWSFMWFVGFCYLTNKWSHGEDVFTTKHAPDWKKNDCRAAIAFSFFSIFSWGALAYFSYRNYQEASESGLFASANDVIGRQVPPGSVGNDNLGGSYNPYQNNPRPSGDLSGGYQQFTSEGDAYKSTPY